MPESEVSEVYRLIGELRTDIMNRLDKIETSWESRFNVHRVEHEREEDRRSSAIRWAVTSLLGAAGVAVSLWLGITDKI